MSDIRRVHSAKKEKTWAARMHPGRQYSERESDWSTNAGQHEADIKSLEKGVPEEKGPELLKIGKQEFYPGSMGRSRNERRGEYRKIRKFRAVFAIAWGRKGGRARKTFPINSGLKKGFPNLLEEAWKKALVP